MSDTDVLNGWCYVCNTSIDADVQAHFNQEHQAPATKPKVPMLTWEHRLRNVQTDVAGLLEGTDPGQQIATLDGVIQELYLVRAKLSQMKRNKEGTNNGRN